MSAEVEMAHVQEGTTRTINASDSVVYDQFLSPPVIHGDSFETDAQNRLKVNRSGLYQIFSEQRWGDPGNPLSATHVTFQNWSGGGWPADRVVISGPRHHELETFVGTWPVSVATWAYYFLPGGDTPLATPATIQLQTSHNAPGAEIVTTDLIVVRFTVPSAKILVPAGAQPTFPDADAQGVSVAFDSDTHATPAWTRLDA